MPHPLKQTKYLSLLRHAKSSWGEPGLDDFDRPLNERGQREAPVVAEWIADQGLTQPAGRPTLILSSPACRAITTAAAAADALELSAAQIQTDQRAYLAAPNDWLDLLAKQSDDINHLLIVGHNPGLEDLLFNLAGAVVTQLPTAAFVTLELPLSQWANIDQVNGTATCTAKMFPRQLCGELTD